jgi:hypothetical protein
MGWDGMGWDGMGWDGMGWDGMGWDGMGWDGGGEGSSCSSLVTGGWGYGSGGPTLTYRKTRTLQAPGMGMLTGSANTTVCVVGSMDCGVG